MSRARRSALAVAGVLALGATGTAAASATPAQTLPGSVPSWATAAHRTGATAPSTSVTFRVYLGYRDPAGAAAYAQAVSTEGSADYGHFLTPQQFRARFSPTARTVGAVSGWLRHEGFSVGSVPANRKYVEATGTAGRAAAAFGTSFAQFRVDGRTVRGNTTPLHVPAGLTGVEAVVGLDESQTLAHADKLADPPAGFRNARPCSEYWGQRTVQNTATPDGTTLPDSPSTFAPCGYAGSQLQGAYGLKDSIASGTDGRGVTVGVIDAYASPTIQSDLETYSRAHGLPSVQGHFRQVVAPGTYQHPTNPRHDPGGWAGEETLDLEAVHTMAPGADLVYIGAPNNYRDLDAIMNRVVDGHLADIVSNSYGYGGEALPRGYIAPQLDTQIQAAAEGISLFFSSGDSGDETGGVAGATPTPDWPASSPWVTAVGGTSLGVTRSDQRLFEVGWETARSSLDPATTTWGTPTYLYGSGGGTSRLFAQPSYQKGVVPDSIATTYGGGAMRTVPDVSALGDPNTGMLVGETQAFSDGTYYDEYRIGGTSLSSPLYAGMFADAMQRAGHPYGLANPALYAARGSGTLDITTAPLSTYPGTVRVDYVDGESGAGGYRYSARYFDADHSLTIHVRPGYDDVTGVGSPDGGAWLDAVSGYGG
ncbi:S53 family peptidase [Phycicoccus flavus]|uniref:S8/S53 family peptidase n=1 Tax=Phycicoccus flavus TaxID=2502783 RepID=A0A8T6R4W3_9MICO|nr:S53 family peptidase [Phycicoccus flavus]NHA68916.1 S8/S53 family peptidase [Phycicoccus flavus]